MRTRLWSKKGGSFVMANDAVVAGIADEDQIRRVMEDWRRLTAEGDVDGLLSLAGEPDKI
jgi:hypothetical protein